MHERVFDTGELLLTDTTYNFIIRSCTINTQVFYVFTNFLRKSWGVSRGIVRP